MDAFELNKIIGAVLFAVLVLFGMRTVSDILFAAHPPEKPGLEVEIAETDEGKGPAGGEEKEVALAVLLNQGSAEKGETVAKKCAQCHSFEQGGKKPTGPTLYGIVGKPKAEGDFAYSTALKEKGGTWTFEDLDHFIANPKGWLPGTKMAFAGIKKADQRADLLLYLRSLSDSPVPLPTPAETAKPADEAGEKTSAAPADPAATPAQPGEQEGEKTSAAPAEPAPKPAEPEAQPPAAENVPEPKAEASEPEKPQPAQ